METLGKLSDCRYCSQVSKANGEDPIGSAPQVDYWLLVEIKPPWPTSMFEENPIISQVISMVRKLTLRRGILIRPIVIAPDPDYSTPGLVRIIYYGRPAKQFSEYEKQEYLVPEDEVPQLVIALLNHLFSKKTNLTRLQDYQQDTQHIREMLVCTHTQVDLACGRFGTPIYRKLRQTYGQPGQSVRVWQSTHFGGHQFAPTLIDLPRGQLWGHLEPDVLPQLIDRSGDHHQMRRFYRGWAGCTQFEQIADREAWMQEGWDWFTYPRTASDQRRGLKGLKRFIYPALSWIPIKIIQFWLDFWTLDARRVEVQFKFASPHGDGLYQITVEETGKVLSAHTSPATRRQTIKLTPVKQYRVSRLVKSM